MKDFQVRRSLGGLRRDEAKLQVPEIFGLSGAGPQSSDLAKLHLETVFFFCRRMKYLPTPRKIR